MRVNVKYQLNTEELYKILTEKGWGIEELSEETTISKTHFYRMSLAPDDKNFSPVGFDARKKLRKVLPNAKGLFMPLNVRGCKKPKEA
jgi:hypothetical protein